MTNIENTMTLCAKSDILEGSILKVEVGGLSLAVYRVEDVFYVTDDACTHGPGSLSEGYLDGHVIECDFHNGSFDIRNGEVVAPPCLVKLKTYKTVADAEMVLISLN